jgi:hypothetical protein
MRASELLGVPVRDPDGRPLGFVIDLRCRQDGPLRGAMQAPRVAALLVSRTHWFSMMGYERRRQGPWLLRHLVRLVHRHAFLVPWDDVDFADGWFTLHTRADITPLPE